MIKSKLLSHFWLCNPMDYTIHGILQVRILEWVAIPFSRGSSKPGIEPRSPALQTDSLPGEPPGKPKNTGVGSMSLLQQIFLTQESKLESPALQVDSLPTELSGIADNDKRLLHKNKRLTNQEDKTILNLSVPTTQQNWMKGEKMYKSTIIMGAQHIYPSN